MPQHEAHVPFDLQVVRRGSEVVVVLHGPLDETAVRHVRHVLTDLVDGQGNLFVAVEYGEGADEELCTISPTLQPPVGVLRDGAGIPAGASADGL